MSCSMLVYRRDATVGRKLALAGSPGVNTAYSVKTGFGGQPRVNATYVEEVNHKGSRYADRAAMRSARLAA